MWHSHCKPMIGWLQIRPTCQLVLERLAIAQLGALLDRPRNNEMQGNLQRSLLSYRHRSLSLLLSRFEPGKMRDMW